MYDLWKFSFLLVDHGYAQLLSYNENKNQAKTKTKTHQKILPLKKTPHVCLSLWLVHVIVYSIAYMKNCSIQFTREAPKIL